MVHTIRCTDFEYNLIHGMRDVDLCEQKVVDTMNSNTNTQECLIFGLHFTCH